MYSIQKKKIDMTYVEKFRLLLKELYENENVAITQYLEYRGVTDKIFEEIETKIGFKLPQNLKQFYSELNGIRISWNHKKDEQIFDEDDEEYFNEVASEFKMPTNLDELILDGITENTEDSETESGSISIKSIQNVFLEPFPSNKDLIREGFYVFDAFSAICGAAISFPNSKDETIISFNGDHYTHFSDYENSMKFDNYIDFLIKTKGIKNLRTNQKNIKYLDSTLTNWHDEFYFSE